MTLPRTQVSPNLSSAKHFKYPFPKRALLSRTGMELVDSLTSVGGLVMSDDTSCRL